MRRSLTDQIEQYIKALIARSQDGQIEIQRIELAETFACVPSQITYVISTRFTLEQGYYSESRRGGNGYVKIRECRNTLSEPNLSAKNRNLLAALNASNLMTAREKELLKKILLFNQMVLPGEHWEQFTDTTLSALKAFLENKEE